MTRLRTVHSYKFGQKNIIPYAGEVSIGTDGIIEVDDDIAQSIVDCNIGFEFVDMQGVEVTTTTTLDVTTTTTVVEVTTTTTEEEVTTTTTEVEQVTTTTTSELEDQTEQDDLSQKTTGSDELEALYAKWDEENTLAQLKELAKSYPSKEWRNLDKAELIKYLIGKQGE